MTARTIAVLCCIAPFCGCEAMPEAQLLFVRFFASTLAVLVIAFPQASFTQDRTIDGSGNNIANPAWGSANTQLFRLMPSQYDDGISLPAGASRPSARAISNAVSAQSGSILNNRSLMDYVWQCVGP